MPPSADDRQVSGDVEPGQDATELSAMKADARHEWLVNQARERRFARVSDLADELGVSGMTIRRDLQQLEELGLVRRVRGGVVPGTGAEPGRDAHAVELVGEHRVGVLIPEVSGYRSSGRMPDQPPDAGYYFERVLAGVRTELQRAGLRPRLMFSPGRTPERDAAADRHAQAVERRAVEEMVASGVTGLLFSPNGADGPMDDYLDWLATLSIPVVLMEREIGANAAAPSVSSVRSAHEVGVAVAVEHLSGLGHQRIQVLRHHQSQTATAIQRGWESAAAERGLDVTLSCAVSDLPGWPEDSVVDGFLRKLRRRRITALLCHNDNNAYAVLRRAAALGIAIPDELSLVSYDDDFADLFEPPLTAVGPPRFYVGRLAARLLLDRFDSFPSSAAHIRVEPSLAVRGSTGPAAG